MITDMTEGSPSKILWKFSIPLLLSVIFQQLYNVVDSVVAGQFVSVDALAAVGASYPITMIFMAVATGSNIGCSVIISQLFGAKHYKEMKTAISTSLLSIVVLSLVLTGIGLYFCAPLMRLLGTPDNIFADSELYLNIYIGGLIFLFLYNICTGIFTALGDSRTPLYFLIFSSLSNIVLDLFFVISLKMGVAGVAWATFLCQGIASFLAFFALMRRISKIPSEKYPKFSFTALRDISIVAIPSILQQSFISVGNLFIQGFVNNYGSIVIAGYSSAIKLNTFAVTSFTTLANGLSSFTAQNIGANKVERVRQGYRSGILLAICVVIPFFIAYFFFSRTMISIFLDSSNIEVLDVGNAFLKIVSPFYIVVTAKLMADGVLRGAGSMFSFMLATFSDLILRVVLSYVLSFVFHLGATGIWMSWPIGWTLSAIMSTVFYKVGVWKKHAEKYAVSSDANAESISPSVHLEK